MIRDAANVTRLIGSVWFGDLSRSVTGSRQRSTVLLWCAAAAVLTWQYVAIATAQAGFGDVPPSIQLQLVGEILAGTALAGGCVVTVLTVLTPPSRELAAMLAGTPVRPGSWILGHLAAPITIAAVLAPLVMSPIIASSVQLSMPTLAAPIILGTIVAAFAGSIAVTAAIRGMQMPLQHTGLPHPVATSIAAGITLAAAAGTYATWSRREWVAALPLPTASADAWAAITITAAIAAAAAAVLIGVARITPPENTTPVVRWCTIAAHRPLSSLRADLIQGVRNPMLVSTLTLLIIAAVGAVIATPPGAPAWASVLLLFFIAFPASVTLIAYGTNRRPLWLRSLTRPADTDRWGAVKLTTATVTTAILLTVVALGAVALGHTAITPWSIAVPCAILAAAASLLAGVHFPADLEIPGAPVLAFLEAAALTAAPILLATTAPAGAMQITIVLTAAALCAGAVPPSIASRRRRAITA